MIIGHVRGQELKLDRTTIAALEQDNAELRSAIEALISGVTE
jgi:hypothetical protein